MGQSQLPSAWVDPVLHGTGEEGTFPGIQVKSQLHWTGTVLMLRELHPAP